jgi:hypothetical protein
LGIDECEIAGIAWAPVVLTSGAKRQNVGRAFQEAITGSKKDAASQ